MVALELGGSKDVAPEEERVGKACWAISYVLCRSRMAFAEITQYIPWMKIATLFGVEALSSALIT